MDSKESSSKAVSKAPDMASDAKNKAADMASDAKNKAADMASGAKNKASDLAQKAKSKLPSLDSLKSLSGGPAGQAMDLGKANPKISPLIKGTRWGLLVFGVFWGFHRRGVNKRSEDEVRAYNARMQPVWDEEEARKAAKINREQMIYLAKETGTPIPPDF